MSKQNNMVETPWGKLRLGDTVIVSTSQKKQSRPWFWLHKAEELEAPPLNHLGTFIGILKVNSERTTSTVNYPNLQDYVMIETIPGVRTQIPFSNIDFIK